MSKSLNHNQIPFGKIEKYVHGKMTSAQKNEFEKHALNDVFLQDAIDGYLNNPSALSYYNKKLKSKYKVFSNAKYYFLTFTLLFILITGVLVLNHNTKKHKLLVNNNLTNKKDSTTITEFEVLPLEIDTLESIEVKKQIIHKEIVQTQNQKKDFNSAETSKFNSAQKIELLDVQEIEDDDNVEPTSQNKTKIYPFLYFYDIAVVDYTKYENRTKTISKTTYVLTGTQAIYENNDSKQSSELTQKKVDVAYMDYLEKSIYYFSKHQYKKALNRFQIINQQYKNDLNALFYGGLSNYNLGRYDNAIEDFTQIINLNKNPFYDDALWYRAKTYLQVNQKNKAKIDLKKLALYSTFYQKQALNLLKEF
jgi:tetratricopeptide (TPR) repeat protein